MLPFAFIISSIIFVPNFRIYNGIDKEILSLLPNLNINDKFLIYKMPYPTFHIAFYSYASIYYNLSTPDGALPDETIATPGVIALLTETEKNFVKGDCNNLLKNLKRLNATAVISYKDYCGNLNKCGMNLEAETDNVCLYKI